ncbi:MAG: hypothetical protein F2842_07100 [Actinobacteria bacterium]|uniref:Unannotated protein n=1 Tax=freshwater metagenome TaxID=449393 RepID=A0A6J7K9C5_9ZZZZ|nr:hypothetical protein [Actinomycetota bacterium]
MPTVLRFSGKVVVVAGVGSGLGADITRRAPVNDLVTFADDELGAGGA